MADAEALAQGAAERLFENESLRGDLTDAGYTPVSEWAMNALIAAANEAAQHGDEEAQARMDEAEATAKRIVGEIVRAAERHTREEITVLLKDPTIARNLVARMRVLANGWRLGDDADANAIRLIGTLRGVEL